MTPLAVLALLGVGLCQPAGQVWAAVPAGEAQTARRPLAGRPLSSALQDLQARGLQIVFSTEVVRPIMRVEVEPRARSDRDALDEILAAHGLKVRGGPAGTLIVVRAPTAEATPAPRAGGTIRGVVVDARTATPLAGVLIRLAGRRGGERLTDADGRFELAELPAGRHTLFASLVGYSLARPAIELAPGAIQDLTVALAEGTGTYTEQVTVTGDPFRATEQAVPSVNLVSGSDLLALRGVLSDDPLRAVQALPGVAGNNDFRSEFSVRGSDYRHIGLSIDGMPIDWPVHAVRGDASGGSVSLVNSDVVERMALFSGAYPQDRPARTGARLDFSLREGSRVRPQVRGALSMTSASLILEGPFGGSEARGSWLVATRQSYVQWILKRMGSDGSTAFGFSDVQGKAVYDVSPTQRVDVTIVGGQSRLDLDRLDDDPNLVGNGAASALLVSAGWRAARGRSMTIEQRLSASRYGFRNERVDGAALGDGDGTTLAYRGGVTWAIPHSLLLSAAGHIQRDTASQVSTRFIERFSPYGVVPRTESLGAARVLWSGDVRASRTLPHGVAADLGVLVSGATNDAARPSPSPWLTLAVPLGSGLSIRSGAGIYRQQPALDQSDGTFASADVGAEVARQYEIGLEHRWRPDARLQVTAYTRRERGMLRLGDDEYRSVEGDLQPPSLEPRWTNALDGSSSGIEALVERRSAVGLSGWLWYGYARTRYRDRRTAERFVGDFDERHTVGAFAQYRLSPVTSVSAKLRVGSNVPVPGYFRELDGEAFVGNVRNDVRLPAYARLDVRANRVFNFDSRRLTLFVEVVNTLARTNYAPGFGGMRVRPDGRVAGSSQSLFPFLPTAGILIEF